MPADGHIVNLPPLGAVAAEIGATSAMSRNEAVAALKELRSREFAAINRHLIEHINETTGLDVVLQISALTDAVVRNLAERAVVRAAAPPDWREQVAFFAVGGYGRGEMNPHSDLDLLMLDRVPGLDWTARVYSELQALLWDVKFQVGASHRSLPDLAAVIDEDFVTATAVVESRQLLADPGLQAGMAGLLQRFRKRRSTTFLRYKLSELAKRREAAGASLFVMEPNLKSSPGGLRDVQLLSNMAFIACGSRNILALGELDAITRADLTGVLASNDHLLELRSLLHFTHGRKQDVFQLGDQVKVAKLLGYADVSRLRAVEHFMRRHYAQVRHVQQVLELTVSRLEAKGFLGGRLKPLIATRRSVVEGFSAIAGRVYLADPDFWRRPDAGVRLLGMCREAQRRDLRLSIELQRAIHAHLEAVDDGARREPAAARDFLAILGEVGRIRPILSDMHAAGLLGAYLPEFGLITCHMQFDSWHQYTVDEHTLIALGNLDQLATGKAAGLPGMDRIFPGVQRKDLLALGLLLHDVGKYMGRGHVARGAIMVQGVAQRLGLGREEEDLLHWLVEQHVILSDASRMRNFREPAFLKPFAERIGTVARLDALYCLTWADAKAVGEGVLTGWQEALLGELHQTIRDQLAGVSVTENLHARLRRELEQGGVPRAAAEAHLADLGGTYEHQMAPGEVLHHWRVLADARRAGVGLIHDLRDRHVHIALALPDRHALFTDVAATLSGHGFDIVDLRTWVTTVGGSGWVVYTMRLSSVYPGRLGEETLWARLRADLLAVSQGKLDARTLLARRRATVITQRVADSGFEDHAIKVDSATSDRWTIVDVVTRDQVGLLAGLCRSISDAGGEIGYACINTMGDVAVDVFYVNRAGRKLDAAEAEALRRRMASDLGLASAG